MTYTRKLNGAVARDDGSWKWRDYGISRHWFIGGSRWGVWQRGELIMMVADGRVMVRALIERERAK